jgi:hypothetical protein
MKVSELLDTPDKWTQWWFARDKGGRAVEANDPEAVCYCLMGAVKRCYGDNPAEKFQATANLGAAIAKRAGIKPYFGLVSVWNDAPGRTFAEVQEVVREAGI